LGRKSGNEEVLSASISVFLLWNHSTKSLMLVH